MVWLKVPSTAQIVFQAKSETHLNFTQKRFLNLTDKNKYGQTYLIISLNNQKKSTIIFCKVQKFL